MRFKTKYPEHFAEVSRISLVSSFLASVFLGKVAPIDISDVTGMNLWDISKGDWRDDLLALTAGGKEGAAEAWPRPRRRWQDLWQHQRVLR
jgi:xylulokinase